MKTIDKYKSFIKEIPASVNVLAVSKTKSEEEILELYNAGHRDFGENYVQELIRKQENLPKDIRWHFIGHLQTNKVKYIVPFVYLIHSVDSLKLAREINKEAVKIKRNVSVLLQCYAGKEETKFGLSPEEVRNILTEISHFSDREISVNGLMAMATNTDDLILVEEEFTLIKELFNNCKSQFSNYPDFKILSMGMSTDYKSAISCGSNLIRIGSLIFGERNYSK